MAINGEKLWLELYRAFLKLKHTETSIYQPSDLSQPLDISYWQITALHAPDSTYAAP